MGFVISTGFCGSVFSDKVDSERPSAAAVELKNMLTKLGCSGSGLVRGGAEQER